jgi:hypothetical protein
VEGIVSVVEKTLRLVYRIPDNVPALRAGNALLQRVGEDEFLLMFFDDRRPILMGNEEERRQQLEDVNEVHTVCVARIALSGRDLGMLQKVINEQYKPKESSDET